MTKGASICTGDCQHPLVNKPCLRGKRASRTDDNERGDDTGHLTDCDVNHGRVCFFEQRLGALGK